MGLWTEIEGLIVSKLESIKTILSMTALEAKLTQLSVAPFMMTSVMLFVVLFTLWMALMGILGCFVWDMHHRLMWSFCCVFLVNLLIFLILGHCLRCYLRYMGFQKTRQYIKAMLTRTDDERAKTADKGAKTS